ncbi:MAG: FemAB family PEP-CTERM system-associated protein [Sphingomonadaceae bacterium]|nr:FemAB family PEP-CTERM system-associated protein [Sphingomonadaceae bacterium]
MLAPGLAARHVDWRDAADRARYDAFVRDRLDGTPFHLTAWAQAIAELGHRPHYLLAERGGAIGGVLPLIETRSPLFGRTLVSNAFAVYGGPLADDESTHAVLDDAAWALAGRLGVRVVEYRNQARLRPDWPVKSDVYATFKRPIHATFDENLKAIPRKQRADVRKSLDLPLEVRVGSDARDLADHYAVYAESVRNLGTPVFPRCLFRAILGAFGPDADILTVSHAGVPIASVLSLYHNGEVLPYYGGGTAAARQYKANDRMYFELIEHARQRGCTSFDFGRSKVGTGPYAFKKNWGFEPTPLYYEYRLGEGAEMPNLSPNNPKFKAMIAVWTRLPLWVANRLGPPIASGLG